jgi:hypothetical protein
MKQHLCIHCNKPFGSEQAVYSHMSMKHSVEQAQAWQKRCKQIERAAVRLKRIKDASAARKAAERAARLVTLSTGDIDDIINEMRDLINMMEPYYSQGDCANDAEKLITRLEALADGQLVT